jgi:hypothetical protein
MPPFVSIVSPEAIVLTTLQGNTYTQAVRVRAANHERVEIFVNGSWVAMQKSGNFYTYNYIVSSIGQYDIRVRAVGTDGIIGIEDVSLLIVMDHYMTLAYDIQAMLDANDGLALTAAQTAAIAAKGGVYLSPAALATIASIKAKVATAATATMPIPPLSLKVAIVGVLAIGVVTLYFVITDSPAQNMALEGQLTNAAKEWGRGQCQEAAKAMFDILKKNEIEPLYAEFVFMGAFNPPVSNGEVRSISGGRFLISNTIISWSGHHVGVIYGVKVFCNVHPQGKLIADWFNDFTGVGEQFRLIHPGPYPLGPTGILP